MAPAGTTFKVLLVVSVAEGLTVAQKKREGRKRGGVGGTAAVAAPC